MGLDLLDDESVERVLVVVAHPDDAEFGAAGSVARWTKAGTTVVYCVVTDGETGVDDLSRPAARARRRDEQVAAAAEVGVHDVRFLGHPDGGVTASPALRRDITRVIRQVRPNRVLTHSPELAWQLPAANHPDHRATGEAALAAVHPDAATVRAHHDLYVDEGLEAWSVRELWMLTAPEANHYVDITETFAAKTSALRAHTSQASTTGDLEGRLRPRLAALGEQAGLPQGRLAERFFAVRFA